LRKSLSQYTIESIKSVLTDINEVINILREKYDIVSSMLYGLDYKKWFSLKPEELAQLTVSAYNHIIQEGLEEKFIKNYLHLKKIYALASPHPETIKIKDDIKFFEMIKKMIIRYSTTKKGGISRELEYEINQLISKSISAEEPVDIFSLIQKEKPDLSILDENFLAQFKEMRQKNYAVDLLIKLLNDEIKIRMRKNPFRYKSLYEMLKNLIERYNVKLINTVDVIDELIEIAKEVKKKMDEGKKLNLTEEELAFYDMLLEKDIFESENEIIYVAKEVIKELGNFIKVVDWNKKETLRAKIRMAIKKILIDVVNERTDYEKINKIANEIYEHVESLYAT
jgi:type I restriction enzyme R subunit